MVDLQVVIEKLQSFETADDLAEFFRGYGIQARPRDARACAITKFVMEETGLAGVVTGGCSVRVFVKNEEGWEQWRDAFAHTPAMREFVANYDQGHYPDLIEGTLPVLQGLRLGERGPRKPGPLSRPLGTVAVTASRKVKR